jgi:hypothetical protein
VIGDISNAKNVLVQTPCKPTKKSFNFFLKKHKCTSQLGMAILPAGSDIRRISDLSGSGTGTNFDPWVSPVPDP